MTAIWKCVALLAVLLALQLHVAESVHHQHQKRGRVVDESGIMELPAHHRHRTHDSENDSEENHSCIVHGQIYCSGKPYEGARPYIASKLYPRYIISIAATNENGWYRLSTGSFFDLKEKVTLTVRHQCPIDGLELMPKCAVPYYTTEILVDVSNTTYVGRSLELSKLKSYSTADCLY